MAKTIKGEGKMKINLREIIEGVCIIGVFFGALFIDADPLIGAVIMLGSISALFLLEKGIM